MPNNRDDAANGQTETTGRHPSPQISCLQVLELSPWLLNDSLEEHERAGLLSHIAGCASCSSDLEDTVRVQRLLGQHIPASAIARYALGLSVENPPRELVEYHLSTCESCRDECDRIRSESAAAVANSDRSKQAPRSWGRLAIAAGLVGAACIGVAFGRYLPSQSVDLTPSPAFNRAEDGRAYSASAARASHSFRDGFESGGLEGWSRVGESPSEPSGANSR